MISAPTRLPAGLRNRITTIDAHTAGEPFRVVVDGLPEWRDGSILDHRRFAREHLDVMRRVLMWEPRGHADMYGGWICPSSNPDADLGVLFLHNEGFSTMCGHGIIALATVLLETGMIPMDEEQMRESEIPVGIDTPAGLVRARAAVRSGSVEHVAFLNVPSFVAELDAEVEVPGLGTVRYDLAFGGAFYAYVQSEDLGLPLKPERFREIIDHGRAIKHAVMESRLIAHPFEEDLGFLYGTIFVGPSEDADRQDVHSRNVCVFADGEVDRSPTGTGVSGRLAIHHARGELREGETITIESLIGTSFDGRVAETTRFGDYDAVVPEVTGSAYLTGRHEFFVDPEDPLRDGFLLR